MNLPPAPNRQRAVLTWAALTLLVAAGCAPEGSQVLGLAPTNSPVALAAVGQAAGTAPVTVTGTLVEKCPEAGCWFVLQDGASRLKVDTKMAGFVVVDVPLHRRLTVSGRLLTNGTELRLDATGLRY